VEVKTADSANRPILFGLLLLLSTAYFGCGVKGPPVPPRQPLVPAVELSYQVDDQTVRLTWRLPGPLAAKQAKDAAFVVYRSRTALAEPPCDGCPLVFEKAASVAYVDSDSNRFSIDKPLESGYRYVFKVRLETDSGAGPDSNPVRFDHLPDLPSGASETP
jgi:hypothetical protein